MDKYVEIIKLLERIFGKSAVSKSLGTRTNVVRFPKGKQPIDPTTRHFDVEGTAQKNPELVNTIKNSIEDRMGDITKMNDQELLTYKQNLQRLADYTNPPPMADVIEAGSKQRVTGEGLEKLIEEQGLVASPKTELGSAQFNLKRAEQEMKDFVNNFDLGELIKGAGKDQLSLNRLHNEGLVRAVTRQILSEDIKAGKVKGLTLDDLGTSREPIDYFRKIYGEDALEQLDSLAPEFNRLTTEQEGAKLARSKFKIEPKETPVDESKTYDELEKMIKKDEPENKADGGSIGLDYLMGLDVKDIVKDYPKKYTNLIDKGVNKFNEIGDYADEYIRRKIEQALTDEQRKKFNLFMYGTRDANIADIIKESANQDFSKPSFNFERRTKEAIGGRVGYAGGGDVKKILDLIAKANKELKGKKSMETVNPKTGEVTIPKEPVKTLNFDTRSEFDKLNIKHDKDIVAAANEIGVSLDDPKMAAQQIAEVYADMKLGKDYYDLSQNQQLDLYSKAYNYLTDMGSLKRQSSAVTKYNAGEKLEPFNQKIINKINDTQQKEILTDFDIKDRKPNKDGGLNHLLGF